MNWEESQFIDFSFPPTVGITLPFMNILKLSNFSLTYVFYFQFIFPKIKLTHTLLVYQQYLAHL